MSEVVREAAQAAQATAEPLLDALQKLLAIEALDVRAALDAATNELAGCLGADKVDAFLFESGTTTLVARGTSDTPMGRRQKELGLDRLPLANGGRVVEVYETKCPFLHGHVDRDERELVGIREALGVRSSIIAPLEVRGVADGVLLASSARSEFFGEADLRFLEAVGRWVGLVAHRAQLTERVATEARQEGRQRAAAAAARVDIERLRQALENVVSNAVRHSPLHGVVTVTVDVERRGDGEWVLLTVTDQGPGLPAELAARHAAGEFPKFGSGPRSGGMGLGLYVASRVAAAHGGTLRAMVAPAPRPGQGAAFRFELPK